MVWVEAIIILIN